MSKINTYYKRQEIKIKMIPDLIEEKCIQCSKHFYCGECLNMAIDIVMCSKCNYYYCKSCFQDLINNDNHCYYCDSEKYMEIEPLYYNILKKIKLSCLWCKTSLFYEEFVEHVSKCPESMYVCTFTNCDFVGSFQDAKIHVQTCQKSKIECKFCQSLIYTLKLKEHYTQECREIPISCSLCKTLFTRDKEKSHLNSCSDNIKEFLKTLSNEIKNENNKEIIFQN